MEYSATRTQTSSRAPPNMSMLAMITPTPHDAAMRHYSWNDPRSRDHVLSRPRTEPDKIALPSIRQVVSRMPGHAGPVLANPRAQAIPELHLAVPREGPARSPSATTSPIVSLPGAMTPPEYVHSPNSNKRRRLSIDEREERACRVPRLHTAPLGPALWLGDDTSPATATRSETDSWKGSSSRTSPLLPHSAGLPSMRSPPLPMESGERAEGKFTLPSLPLLHLERSFTALPPPARGFPGDDYVPAPGRPVMVHPGAPGMDVVGPGYRQTSYGYGYHHPTRVQSLSLGSIPAFDRSPFSANIYPYHEYMRMSEYGGMGLYGDGKQRKRRGNLPKETTDKLRAWFVAHLHHPYPTEDEKQDLIRQTGLQMSESMITLGNGSRGAPG